MSQQANAAAAMSEAAELKSFARPDEVREFPKGRLELIKIGGATIGRAVFEPGASSVRPIAHTKSCEAPHFQYHVAGVLRVKMDNGSEFDCKPGDVSLLPAGHDAWVVGNEPAIRCVLWKRTSGCSRKYRSKVARSTAETASPLRLMTVRRCRSRSQRLSVVRSEPTSSARRSRACETKVELSQSSEAM